MRHHRPTEAAIATRSDGYDDAIAVLHMMVARKATRLPVTIAGSELQLVRVGAHADPVGPNTRLTHEVDLLFLVNNWSHDGHLEWPIINGVDAHAITYTYNQLKHPLSPADERSSRTVRSNRPSRVARQIVSNRLDDLLRNTMRQATQRYRAEPQQLQIPVDVLFDRTVGERVTAILATNSSAPIAERYQAFLMAQHVDSSIDAAIMDVARRDLSKLAGALVRDSAIAAAARTMGYRLESVTTRIDGRHHDAVMITRGGIPALADANQSSPPTAAEVAAAHTLIREIRALLPSALPRQDRGLGD